MGKEIYIQYRYLSYTKTTHSENSIMLTFGKKAENVWKMMFGINLFLPIKKNQDTHNSNKLGNSTQDFWKF